MSSLEPFCSKFLQTQWLGMTQVFHLKVAEVRIPNQGPGRASPSEGSTENHGPALEGSTPLVHGLFLHLQSTWLQPLLCPCFSFWPFCLQLTETLRCQRPQQSGLVPLLRVPTQVPPEQVPLPLEEHSHRFQGALGPLGSRWCSAVLFHQAKGGGILLSAGGGREAGSVAPQRAQPAWLSAAQRGTRGAEQSASHYLLQREAPTWICL